VGDILGNQIILKNTPFSSTLKTLAKWSIFVKDEKIGVLIGLTVEEKGVIWFYEVTWGRVAIGLGGDLGVLRYPHPKTG
jgi:flavin-dependent dehydrogenase